MDKTIRMSAMQITGVSQFKDNPQPLVYADVPIPEPGPGQVLLKVLACAVCHTELDEIEGRTPPDQYPRIPGHQVIGEICKIDSACKFSSIGQRVGVAWIYSSCRKCRFCIQGLENLCSEFKATGRDVDGGYANYMVVDEAYVHAIPDELSSIEAAPLLCAGAVGYRALKLCSMNNKDRLGFTGFGASAHLVLKLAKQLYPNSEFYVFARDASQRAYAYSLGAEWVGNTREHPDKLLHAIIDTTPAWQPVVSALECLEPSGRLVINAIRKQNEDIVTLETIDYAQHLWMEKTLRTVANVTRADVREFLGLAAHYNLIPKITEYQLTQANLALANLASGGGYGAHVLRIW